MFRSANELFMMCEKPKNRIVDIHRVYVVCSLFQHNSHCVRQNQRNEYNGDVFRDFEQAKLPISICRQLYTYQML